MLIPRTYPAVLLDVGGDEQLSIPPILRGVVPFGDAAWLAVGTLSDQGRTGQTFPLRHLLIPPAVPSGRRNPVGVGSGQRRIGRRGLYSTPGDDERTLGKELVLSGLPYRNRRHDPQATRPRRTNIPLVERERR